MLVDGDRLTPALLAAVCAKAAGRARTLELTFAVLLSASTTSTLELRRVRGAAARPRACARSVTTTLELRSVHGVVSHGV